MAELSHLRRPPASMSWRTVRRPRGAGDVIRTAVPLIVAMVVLSLYTNSKNPAFLSRSALENILTQVAVLGILAVGQTLLVVGGQLDLSVGSVVSFTSVIGAYLYSHHWSEPAILLVMLAIGAGVGLLWGLLVTYLRVPAFILTLGGLSAFSSLASVISHNRPISVIGAFSSLGFGQWLGLPAPAVVFLAAVVLGALVLHGTRFGRQLFALGSSEDSAYLAGLPTRGIKLRLFLMNGLLVGVAGLVQLGRLSAGDPSSGRGLELASIAAIVLGGVALTGGRGTMFGSLLGTLTFGVTDASLVFLNVGGAWQSLVTGGVLILAVTVTALAEARRGRISSMRRGLMGLTSHLLQRPTQPSMASNGSHAAGDVESGRPAEHGPRHDVSPTPPDEARQK